MQRFSASVLGVDSFLTMETYPDELNSKREAWNISLYSYTESSAVEIWDDFKPGDEVVAISHHATCDPDELPVVRGEMLTFMVQHGDKYCKAKNASGRIGFLPLSHISMKERFHVEPWYLDVCTKKIAEAIVNPEPAGSFLFWRSHEDPKKILITLTVKTQVNVEHFEFVYRGCKLVFADRIYMSVYHVIDGFMKEGLLKRGIPVKFPDRKTDSNHTHVAESLILSGSNLVAKKSFNRKNKTGYEIRLTAHYTYNLIGTLSDQSWYVVRDSVIGVEGFAPADYFSPLQPSWFHGVMNMTDIESELFESQRTCSFLVAKTADRHNKRTPYVLAVLDPQRKVRIFEIEYKAETVGCFHSVKESIVQLINGFLIRQTVPMLRYAIQNKELYCVQSETTELDMKSMVMYYKALEEGTEKDYNIRLMLVGHFGVGKTTVARRLLQESLDNLNSTEGIETLVRRARIDIHTGEWSFERNGHDLDLLDERMVHVVRENSTTEHDNEETEPEIVEGYHTIIDPFAEEQEGYDTVFDPQIRRKRNMPRRRILSESDLIDRETQTHEKTKILRYSLRGHPVDKIRSIVKRSSKASNQYGFVSVWDFAGQYLYYATHQVFLATNAIYFLLLDLSKRLDEVVEVLDHPGNSSQHSGKTTRAFIELWLQSIHAKKDGAIGELPPVVLVGTHKDKLPCSPEEQEEYIDKYFESIRCLFDNSPLINHIQPEQICLDNTIDGTDVSELRSIVFDVARRMPWWGKLKPAKWINLEHVLMSMMETSPITSVKDIIDADKDTTMPVEDEDEVRAFLRTQHNAGHLLYFEEEGLSDSVVLRPQWIIDAFKSFVLSLDHARRVNIMRTFVNEICDKAVLRKDFINHLWKQEDYKQFGDFKDILLLYLTKLSIISKGCSGSETEEFYFVPSLLQECDREQELDFQYSDVDSSQTDVPARTPALFLKVDNNYYHQSLFPSLLADCLGRWQPVSQNNRYKLYRNGGVFSLDKSRTHALSIRLCFLTKDSFYIMCKVANVANQFVDTRKCDEVRRFIVSALVAHLHLHNPGSLEILIQCTHPNVINILGSLTSCETLDTYSAVGCHGHSSSFYKNIIDSQELLIFWYPNGYKSNNFSSLKRWVDKSPDYVNDRLLTDRDCERLALALGFGWEHLGISLGVSNTEMEQFKLDYPQRTHMQIYTMLKRWRRNGPKPVTFLVFVKALFENERVHVDWDAVKNVGEGIQV